MGNDYICVSCVLPCVLHCPFSDAPDYCIYKYGQDAEWLVLDEMEPPADAPPVKGVK